MTNKLSKLQKILGGKPEILSENDGSFKTRELIQREILLGIEWIQGVDCRRSVEKAGLTQMHLFSRKKLPLLVAYLNYRTGKAVLQTFKDFCRREFSLEGNFYIEAVLVYRIHYPYGCREVSSPARPGFLGRLKGVYYLGVLAFSKIFPWIVPLFPGYHWMTYKKPYEDGHAPHRDYWFGYALNAINLWWAIEEVDEENGMMLFPETSGIKIAYRSKGSPYIAEGEKMTRPRFTPLRAGEVLAMNTNELHATRLNESDSTRIVVSVRVSPEKPKFHPMPGNPTHVGPRSYHKADALDRGDFSSLWNPAEDPQHNMWEEPVETGSPTSSSPVVKLDEKWPLKERILLFNRKLLEDNDRVMIHLSNMELVALRTDQGPVLFKSRCPHEGFPLSDGFLGDGFLICPGHGLKFNLSGGHSKCGLQIRPLPCSQSGDLIFLEPGCLP